MSSIMERTDYLGSAPRKAVSSQMPVLTYELRDRYHSLTANQIDIVFPKDQEFFEEELQRHPISEFPHLPYCVDLSRVQHLAAPVLGSLIALNKRIQRAAEQPRQGTTDLCGKLSVIISEPEIFEVFVIIKLNQLFSLHVSREDYEVRLNPR